jgi:succinyl-CoA synthetase beta subunit
MKLLEYEAKKLLKAAGLRVPQGRVVKQAGEHGGGWPVVVKAQVPVGGRGKAGGVKVVHDAREYAAAVKGLLGHELLGYKVSAVLVEEAVKPERELYLAVTVDRTAGQLVLLAHRHGGMDIEEAVREHGAALTVPLEGRPDKPVVGQAAKYLGLAAAEVEPVVRGLWEVCNGQDATLVEVNPLMATEVGLVCADAKVELDDAAAWRHKDWDFEARPASAQFVVLDERGTVASMANGAGLAMATNDAIAAAGAVAANFFDVGGGTNAEDMTRGFAQIRDLKEVRAIVVNIFGGITRCDEVAEAVLAARAAGPTPPLFIRLAGTNAAEGEALLRAAGIELLPTLGDCVAAAAAEARNV